jgi:hypothetical protein
MRMVAKRASEFGMKRCRCHECEEKHKVSRVYLLHHLSVTLMAGPLNQRVGVVAF